MVFDCRAAKFLFPKSDENLSLSLERDGVPLFLCRFDHMPELRCDVGSEQSQHHNPTSTLSKYVIDSFHKIFKYSSRETIEGVYTMQRVTLLRDFSYSLVLSFSFTLSTTLRTSLISSGCLSGFSSMVNSPRSRPCAVRTAADSIRL